MDGSILDAALYVLGGSLLGAIIGWAIRAAIARRRTSQFASEFHKQLDDVIRQRDEFANEYSRSRSTIESLKATNVKLSDKLTSLSGKSKILAKNVLTLRTERENTKAKIGAIQQALVSLRKKSATLQTEFDKARDFYKRELTKSFERRKALESDFKIVRDDHDSLARLVESSARQHGSAENLLTEAHLRLGQLDVLERNVNKLEEENAQLRQDAVRLKQELDAKERDLTKLEELRLHNQQLVTAVEALENSRQAHEADAERYRQQANESEKESDTLRLKLDDLEKNFADIEKQQSEALEDVRNAAVVPLLRKQR